MFAGVCRPTKKGLKNSSNSCVPLVVIQVQEVQSSGKKRKKRAVKTISALSVEVCRYLSAERKDCRGGPVSVKQRYSSSSSVLTLHTSQTVTVLRRAP